jgi:hypothetical protein
VPISAWQDFNRSCVELMKFTVLRDQTLVEVSCRISYCIKRFSNRERWQANYEVTIQSHSILFCYYFASHACTLYMHQVIHWTPLDALPPRQDMYPLYTVPTVQYFLFLNSAVPYDFQIFEFHIFSIFIFQTL